MWLHTIKVPRHSAEWLSAEFLKLCSEQGKQKFMYLNLIEVVDF